MNTTIENPIPARLSLLFAFFVSFVIGMNLLGGKITSFLGVSVSVAILMMPLTFLITDIVTEVYGKHVTKQFVRGAIIATLIVMAYTALFVTLPAHERYEFGEEYRLIFEGSLRIMFASVIAFAASQLHDIWAFDFWKRKTRGRYLWIRNNASTAVSQAIDTLIFMFIAFYGISEKFDTLFILELALPFYLFKLGIAAFDTPFVYLGVRWLRNGIGIRQGEKTNNI